MLTDRNGDEGIGESRPSDRDRDRNIDRDTETAVDKEAIPSDEDGCRD